MNVRYIGNDKVSPHVRTFYFESDQPFRYVAGQFVDLTVAHDHQDVRGNWRQFTLSSSPTEPHLAVTSKFAANGGSTFKRALLKLQPGDTVQMSEAMGDFVLPLSQDTPLVFIAGGIGITPYRSMAKWLADSGEHRQIQLLHFAKSADKLLFDTDLRTAGIDRDVIANLKADAVSILAAISKPDEAQFYISGPEGMVSSLQHDLRQHGVEAYRIVTDAFLGYVSA